MNHSMNFYKDILVSVFYLGGVAGLMSGLIFAPLALIGTASLVSHFNFR